MFITLYGINNIGKSTQAKRLVERLKKEGYQVEYVKYPAYEIEPSGHYINEYLRGDANGRGRNEMTEDELQMWFAINRYQFEPTLKGWLAEGKIVVAEDYRGTGIAWGTTKGADTEWLESINSHLLDEDFVVMLDGERFIRAKEAGHAHEDNDEFMQRSREVHDMLAEKYGWTVVQTIPGDIDGTADRVWDLVAKRLPGLHIPEKSA
jgi:dTMP kinase